MKITIIYFEPFLSLTQKREEEVTLEEGATINKMASLLARQYGEEFRKFAGHKDTYPATVFFREGETLNLARETILKNGDRIVIAMPVGGG
ncbi:MAG: MoaD/ThiS family protein [Planctomycetes bacterium]|nr:MoaD/ThiS family protein [Planctomycetota bacterium]